MMVNEVAERAAEDDAAETLHDEIKQIQESCQVTAALIFRDVRNSQQVPAATRGAGVLLDMIGRNYELAKMIVTWPES